ncbi:ABC transporter ATP-binding protein [Dactylosporangium sp. AC04546]|uniref:ABC transporter ATP-binding protein n=1 Tax=Dactylosporangium sp. AC04546 TaxID=2862460 RepID=UPI001EDE901C|nr:ABC transporter ATP-binding protein [Dactylosporangium sp. AC04546]WVK84409.1 ABC transporter ATP-binding protein [Dactylosporangium sp. AC04546]
MVDVDLDVARGELVALLGESGSGKSAAARAVMGLSARNATVSADALRLGDTDLLGLAEPQLRHLRGTRMSMVFQDALSALNPVLTIGDQIGELFREHRDMSRRQARVAAVDLLGQVGIPAPARRVGEYPHQFSGGMRQRILIAMAIALRPELVIADEPTTALDVTVQAQILELLDSLRRELNMAVLLITHDLGVVSEVADRVMVMYAGRVVEAGSADDLLGAPAHPYTEALLRSVPQADQRGQELYAIPGSPPSPAHQPAGCAFHPRCGFVVDRCRTERPLLTVVAGGRTAACHRTEEVHHAAVTG